MSETDNSIQKHGYLIQDLFCILFANLIEEKRLKLIYSEKATRI